MGFRGIVLSDEKKIETVRRLANFCGEAVILNTCNRFEVYIGKNPGAAEELLQELGVQGVHLKDEEAARHLLMVAAGLDSLLPGEKQILLQVKDALDFSRECGVVGKELKEFFRKAVNTGKKVRAKTGMPSLTIGMAAAEFIDKREGIGNKTVFILGAGKMGAEIARAIEKKRPKEFFIASRTVGRAEALGAGKAIEFKEMLLALGDADILFVAASAPYLLLGVKEILFTKPKRLVIMDISAPPVIEESVSLLPQVCFHDMRDLKPFIRELLAGKEETFARAKIIVEQELMAAL